jgi:hypothetical protein
MIGDARARDEKALRDLYAQYAGTLDEHRARVIHSCFAALGDPSSLIPALWLDSISREN